MLGYRERVKRRGRIERWFVGRVLSVCKVKVVSGIACHGGIGSLYSFIFSRIN